MQNCDPTSDRRKVYRKYNQSLCHFFYFFQQNLNVITDTRDAKYKLLQFTSKQKVSHCNKGILNNFHSSPILFSMCILNRSFCWARQ